MNLEELIGFKMNLEELIGFEIVDIVDRCISKKRGIILKKGEKMFLLEATEFFEVCDVKVRKETGKK